jgi:site-specific recombinase XerD
VQRLPIVSDWVRTLLVRYISLHPRHTEYLIYSRKKPYRYSVSSLSHLITKTLREYGVEAKAHDLRHSRATNLLRMGLDIRALQVFLGHSSIAMTERYTHLTEVDLKKMIEELYAKAQK